LIHFTFKHKYLAISLFFAIFSGFSIYWYLEEKTSEIEKRHNVELVPRIVASRVLTTGARLLHDDLAIKNLPAGYISHDSFSLDQISSIIGKVLIADVRPGEPLTRLHLSDQEPLELSSKIDPGHRAITIPVDQINSISGLLKPNDKIDLYVSFEHSGKRLTALLVENITVLATGQSLSTSEEIHTVRSMPASGFATVTLSATAEQAVKIVAARQDGKITAVLSGRSTLHPKMDKSPKIPGGDLAGLLGLSQADGDENQSSVIYGDLMQRDPFDKPTIDLRQQFDDAFETP
jgi:pilus assembly protein CpaB